MSKTKKLQETKYYTIVERLEAKGFVSMYEHNVIKSFVVSRYETWIKPPTQEIVLLECLSNGDVEIFKPDYRSFKNKA